MIGSFLAALPALLTERQQLVRSVLTECFPISTTLASSVLLLAPHVHHKMFALLVLTVRLSTLALTLASVMQPARTVAQTLTTVSHALSLSMAISVSVLHALRDTTSTLLFSVNNVLQLVSLVIAKGLVQAVLILSRSLVVLVIAIVKKECTLISALLYVKTVHFSLTTVLLVRQTSL